MGSCYKKVEFGPRASPGLLDLRSIPFPFSALYGRGLIPAGCIYQAPGNQSLAGSSQYKALIEDWKTGERRARIFLIPCPLDLGTSDNGCIFSKARAPTRWIHCGSSIHLVTTVSVFQSQYLFPFIPPAWSGIGLLLLLIGCHTVFCLASQLFHNLVNVEGSLQRSDTELCPQLWSILLFFYSQFSLLHF